MSAAGASERVRDIDAGLPPTRYARGWHCLGLAEQFRDGSPHAVEAFGTRLVVWADSAGRLNVLDGYCRHMGGDLTRGTVKGDEVACPFHDWRWGGDGRCKQIPYAKRIPLRARTRSWHAMERNKQLFVWHDAEGNGPIPEQDIPVIEELETGEWTDWRWNVIDVPNARVGSASRPADDSGQGPTRIPPARTANVPIAIAAAPFWLWTMVIGMSPAGFIMYMIMNTAMTDISKNIIATVTTAR